MSQNPRDLSRAEACQVGRFIYSLGEVRRVNCIQDQANWAIERIYFYKKPRFFFTHDIPFFLILSSGRGWSSNSRCVECAGTLLQSAYFIGICVLNDEWSSAKGWLTFFFSSFRVGGPCFSSVPNSCPNTLPRFSIYRDCVGYSRNEIV